MSDGLRIARRVVLSALPWSAGVLAFIFVPSTVWGEGKTQLIAALGLLCGAILLRIMRPFPITDPDAFSDIDEIHALENALLSVINIFSVIALMSILTIALLTFRDILTQISFGISVLDTNRGELYSGAIAILITYVFTRLIYVIGMDKDMLRRQAKGVRTAFNNKRRKHDAELRALGNDVNFRLTDDADYPGREKRIEH